MEKIFSLSPSIAAHVTHFSPIAVGSELHRIIYEVYSDPSQPSGGLLKFYEVWVSEEYIEDEKHLTHSVTEEEILDFANNHLLKRFKDSGNNVPVEKGAFLSKATGVLHGNPTTFPLKVPDDEKPNFVKTTIMLPEKTQKWLKNYSHQKGIGMGEVIRRVVGDFQAGTTRIDPNNKDE